MASNEDIYHQLGQITAGIESVKESVQRIETAHQERLNKHSGRIKSLELARHWFLGALAFFTFIFGSALTYLGVG